MTDKQIIIDGVDVNGCICYKADGKYDTCGYDCEQTPNCYYKQFKRSEAQCEGMFVTHTDLEMKYKAKEQECEELKQRLQQCWKVEYSFVEQLDKLEADNDSLKSELMQTYCYLDADKETIDQLKADYKDLKKCYKNNLALLDFEETNTTKLVNKVMKLEKTLAEIKEIASHYNDMSGNCVIVNFFEDMCKILQKIKECEVENEQ